VAVALVLAMACGGSGSPPDHPHPPVIPTPSPIPSSISAPLATGLGGAAASVAAQSPRNALAAQAAALALQAGVEANSVTLTASLLAGSPDRAALTSGTAQAFGFQLVVQNQAGTTAPQTFSGVLLFQGASDWVLVAGPSPGAAIPPSVGLLGSGSQLWTASAGQEGAQLQSEGAACQTTSLPPGVSCKVATFVNAGFSITSSTPASTGATGSKTASLATQNLGGGVSLILDCALSSLCPGGPTGGGVHVAVAPSSAMLSVNGQQQFAAVVTGTTNTAVTWSVEEAGGGTVSSSGRYTAPATLGVYHVRATSQQDTAQFGRATVTVNQGASVTVSPNPASVTTLGSKSFSVSVSGLSNSAVTWTVDENHGDFVAGKVTTAGVYTAPSSPGTYHVRATSQVDPSVSNAATVTVTVGCMEGLPPIRPGTGNTLGLSAVRVDSQGRRLVAWTETSTTTLAGSVYVGRYEAGGWTVLGGTAASLGDRGPFFVDLAVDSEDRPVLAYEFFNTTTSTIDVHVASWSAASGWTELTTPISSTSVGAHSLVLVADRPALAIIQGASGAQGLYVEQWNGTSWVVTSRLELTPGDNLANPTLLVDDAGNITVAWDETSVVQNHAVWKPVARKLTGIGAGPIASPNTGNDWIQSAPSLGFDGTGNLVMAWTNYPDAMLANSDGLEVSVLAAGTWGQLGISLLGHSGVVVPERNSNGEWGHPVVLDTATGDMAVASVGTSSSIWAVYEHSYTGAWLMVCDPVQDDGTGAPAIPLGFASGMAFDPVNQQFILAATVTDSTLHGKIVIARVNHSE